MTSTLYSNWAIPFIETLCHAGIKNVVISPGSRSTPLALAALTSDTLQCEVVVDERSAAFFALGQIRQTGAPSVLICTSGSAGAHYFPAIVEAALTHLPLIVITADRPWELQQCGANQTTFQQSWFGQHVKAFFELGEPLEERSFSSQSAAVRVAAQAVYTAKSSARGPVHINARVRKPLEPAQWPLQTTSTKTPFPQNDVPIQILSQAAIQTVAEYCREHSRGVIVCGPGPMDARNAQRHQAICQFSEATGYPVLGEIASSIKKTGRPFVKHASVFFNLPEGTVPLPDLVIEINRPLTTGAYEKFIQAHPEIPRLVLSNDRYVDFTGGASAVFTGDISDALSRISAACDASPDDLWMGQFAEFDARITHLVNEFLRDSPFTEAIALKRALGELEPAHVLCLGNSMVIRDADIFFPTPVCGQVIHQRGASGIDGIISAAAGTAKSSHRSVLAIIGDVSALHDLGGFALLKNVASPLTILILNNHGGQIFNQLPLAKIDGIRDTLNQGFVVAGTPSFEGICRMFDIAWHRADSGAAVAESVRTGLTRKRATVVEAAIDSAPGYRQNLIELLGHSLRSHPLS